MNDPVAAFNIAVAGNYDTWVPGAGGTEPVSLIEGKRYQWCFNPKLHEHAYYCLDDDLILEYSQLPECLRS